MDVTPAIDPEPFVLDGSVTLAWGFEDERNAYAEAILEHLPEARAVVPAIWPLEVANALLVGERRGRSTEAQTLEFIEILSALPIAIDGETPERGLRGIMALARRQNLSAYDAAYLELAMRLGLPIATLDQRLIDAAAAVGVTRFAVS